MNLTLTEKEQADIRRHAELCFPQECCGVITDEGYKPGVNKHKHPQERFKLDIYDTVGEAEVLGIVHSHVNRNCKFSEADISACNESDVPWVLYNVLYDRFITMNPQEVYVPLEGRSWSWGLLDCLTILRDVYKSLGVHIKDYSRSDDIEKYLNSEQSEYEKYFPQEGFRKLDKGTPLQKYDVILMSLGKHSQVGTHVGIYWDESKQSMLHHLVDRLSEVTVYGGWWERHTTSVWRHSSQDA